MSDAVTNMLRDTTENDVWWYLQNYNKPEWKNGHQIIWRYKSYAKSHNLPKPDWMEE